MDAHQALQRSELRTIRAGIHNGVAVIHQSNTGSGAFHVRIVRRDADGQLRMGTMVVVGDFDSLEAALAALHEATGEDIQEWQPDAGIELRLDENGGLQPTGTAKE